MTGIAVGGAALVGVGLGWWGVVAIAALAVVVMVHARDRVHRAAIAVVILTAVMGAWRSSNVNVAPAATIVADMFESAHVVSAPTNNGQFQRFIIEPAPFGEPARTGQAPRTCVVAAAVPEVRIGDILRLSGDARMAIDVPVGARMFLEAQNCAGTLFAPWFTITDSQLGPARVLGELRTSISSGLRGSAPGDTGVLLSGLVTGDDEAFSPERREAFTRTGTTHLTAVSGSNLALIAGILATIGAATLGRHRIAWQAITITGVWAYALISGSHPPAIRAAIVAMAAVFAFGFGRRPDFSTLVVIAAGGMVLIDPTQIDQLGFRLSVAASLALAVVLPALIERDRSSGAASFLAAASAAQIATLPLLLPAFGTVSLISVPANLLVAPLIALTMPIAAIAGLAGLISPLLAELAAVPASFMASATLAVVDVLGTPAATLLIGVPPLAAAVVFAVTCGGLLLTLSGDFGRGLARLKSGIISVPWPPHHASQTVGRKDTDQPVTDAHENFHEPVLPAAAPPIFGRKDPTHAFAADADDAENHPASEENRHQISEDR